MIFVIIIVTLLQRIYPWKLKLRCWWLHDYRCVLVIKSCLCLCQQKTGKWCAAHVRMAWEIHRHQQTQLAVNSSSESVHRKSAEMNHLMVASANPLRPPSSMLPGVSTGMPRPGDRGSAGSLIGPSECWSIGLLVHMLMLIIYLSMSHIP